MAGEGAVPGGGGGWAGPAVSVFPLFSLRGRGDRLSLSSDTPPSFFFVLAGWPGGKKEIGLPQFDS